ncbi:MAG: glycosyltransferase, partial [Geobacter sp.]
MLQLSVIIPVLQEQQRINRTVAAVRRQAPRAEIIVVDGDPAGSTLHVLTDPSVIQLTATAGRGN